MIIRRSFIGFLIIIMILLISSCSKSASTPESTPMSQVSISGTITNLTDARQYFSEESFLQLVRITDDDKISFAFNADGTISIDSDLLQIPIPADGGFFDFRLDNLESGRYLISIQKFSPPNQMRFNAMLVATDESDAKSYVVIDIPEDITLPFQLDLGNVVLILP